VDSDGLNACEFLCVTFSKEQLHLFDLIYMQGSLYVSVRSEGESPFLY
jgi:hypothetical protein